MDKASSQTKSVTLNVQNSMINSNERDHHSKNKFSFKKTIKLLVSFVVGAIIIGGCLYLYKSTTSSMIDSGKYQAVFLTNGQVYFGKLKIQNGGYMVLSDIYYLQTKTKADDGGDVQAAAGKDDVGLEVVKLGSEIHGPLDKMIINKDQVLFFENLKNDGSLTKTIEADKKR